MAFPEPTPVIRKEKAKEFMKRLKRFKLTPEQKEFCKGAEEYYRRISAKEETIWECQRCGRKGLDKFGYHAPSKDSMECCRGRVRRIKWADAW